MSGAKLLASLYEAFGRGDMPTVLGALDPGIRWHEAEGNPYMPSGEAWVGPDAVVANLFAKLGDEWNGFTVHPARAATRASTRKPGSTSTRSFVTSGVCRMERSPSSSSTLTRGSFRT